MKFAIIGTGYVADLYAATLASHPELELIGAYDRVAATLQGFVRRFGVHAYANLHELLSDGRVELILNLTNPRSHFEVTKACLEAGRHVYSEKPLAMNREEAEALAALAAQKGLRLSSAPCSVLSDTAQLLWKAVREGMIGQVRLVYASFEDGMIAPNQAPWTWKNSYGIPWPAKDEFEVGCTYEHAGYVLTWLAAMFGPARRVTSFASCQIPDKGIDVDRMAPDFTVGCIEYDRGIVARVTCGLVAPRDKSVTVIGDRGILLVPDIRNDRGPVFCRIYDQPTLMGRVFARLPAVRRFIESCVPVAADHILGFRKIRSGNTSPKKLVSSGNRVDFLRGPAQMAKAIAEGTCPVLSAELGIHIVELVESLQYPGESCGVRLLKSSFAPPEP